MQLPSRSEIKQGHKLRLHCTFDGLPRPIITWLKDGLPLKANVTKRIKVDTKRYVVIPGLFSWKACNKENELWSYFVCTQLSNTRQLQRQLGGRVHVLFINFWAEMRESAAVTWLQIEPICTTFRRKSILKLKHAEPEDRGTYSCSAQSVLGKSSVDFHVEVIESQPKVDGWKLCPIDSICLNGGVCRLYPIIGEIVCL